MNRLTLAVAGGRKTQSIVDHCATAPPGRRVLVLTFTLVNQGELVSRLDALRPAAATVDVLGWFSFLMRHWIRPYLPCHFSDRRLRGLNFDGDPGRFAVGPKRFLDDEGRGYKLHLSKLAVDVNQASGGAALDRLSRIYDEIHIDEVQDLNGYDLDLLSALMASPIDVSLVGDIRQAVLLTNTHDPRNKQYKGIAIKNWFDKCAARGELEIRHQTATWRSNQAIADFADSIFPDTWGFLPTVSNNTTPSGHDGLFAVATDDASVYLETFNPLCLRHSAASAKHLDLPFINFGMAKGMGVDHVLLAPTEPQIAFLRTRKQLGDTPCCSLYVAVTRARHSVAFVVDNPSHLGLEVWSPTGPSHGARFDVRSRS